MEKAVIYPGQIIVTQNPLEIHSSLGSCVEVVLHDPVRRITGVSIYVQSHPDSEQHAQTARYGCYSLPNTLEKMVRLGAVPERFLARVLGGSWVVDTQSRASSVGKKNIDFALSWLRQVRIPIVSSELGGCRARRVIVSSASFSVKLSLLANASELESSYGSFSPVNKQPSVVVVESSPTVRGMLTRLLQQEEIVTVVGAAADAFEARELLVEYRPDVVLISADLPSVSGRELLQRLMKYFPTPVIMMARPHSDANVVCDSLELGAVDCVELPDCMTADELQNYGTYLQNRVTGAVKLRERISETMSNQFQVSSSARERFVLALEGVEVLLLGGDTGAHFELDTLLSALPQEAPAVVLGLDGLPRAHIEKLKLSAHLNFVEGSHLQPVRPGCVYYAPEGYVLELLRIDGANKVGLVEGSSSWTGISSREILFQSAILARDLGSKLAVTVLSGFSSGGVDTLTRLRDCGVSMMAIDPNCSRIPFLPASAVASGSIEIIVDTEKLLPVRKDLVS